MAKKRKPKWGDIVHVEWVDSCAPIRIWQSFEDAKDYSVLPCQSAGFFIKQDAEALVLGQSFGQTQIANIKAIPTSCVCSIRVVSESTWKKEKIDER